MKDKVVAFFGAGSIAEKTSTTGSSNLSLYSITIVICMAPKTWVLTLNLQMKLMNILI